MFYALQRVSCLNFQIFFKVLGEPDKEPELRVRPGQVQHRGLLPLRRGPDIHGRLQHLRSSARLVSLEVLTWAPPDFIQLTLLTIYYN